MRRKLAPRVSRKTLALPAGDLASDNNVDQIPDWTVARALSKESNRLERPVAQATRHPRLRE